MQQSKFKEDIDFIVPGKNLELLTRYNNFGKKWLKETKNIEE